MNVLISAALLVSASFAAAAPSASAGSAKGCCMRPAENPPRAPQKRALCFGTLWSLAQAGRCAADPVDGAACRDNAFTTLVTVREYNLSWDEKLKECVLVTSGRSGPAPVATCDGNSC